MTRVSVVTAGRVRQLRRHLNYFSFTTVTLIIIEVRRGKDGAGKSSENPSTLSTSYERYSSGHFALLAGIPPLLIVPSHNLGHPTLYGSDGHADIILVLRW